MKKSRAKATKQKNRSSHLDSDYSPQSLDSGVFPLLPLRDLVIFPGMVVPLFIAREVSAAAIETSLNTGMPVLAITQMIPDMEEFDLEYVYDVGTLCQVLQTMRLPDGSSKVMLEGLARHKMIATEEIEGEYPILAETVLLPDENIHLPETEPLKRYVMELFETYARLNPKVPKENMMSIQSLPDAGSVADQIAAQIYVGYDLKQNLLVDVNVASRLRYLAELLEYENEILSTEKRIREEVRGRMDKSQREFFLNEQMRVIQKELGREGDPNDEIDEYAEQLEAAELPKEVRQRAEKELSRMSTMPMLSPEATVVRTYLEWLLELPWYKSSEEQLDLTKAEAVLEADHFGLKKPKERILEYLAVRKLNPNSRGPILCFVGPPGVGKTSLGRSVARATNREFARISLGGMRDEAEIRGHRRTYIGSMPGRLIQAIRKVGVKNPVILLDEIDKLGSDFRGDPSSALLEVLDPEQNRHFSDNYLEVEFDLSQVFFITTANVLYTIPPALKDRMELIELSSYTDLEKVEIAHNYLVPKAVRESGLKSKQISFYRNAILDIIHSYTREAGVRNLEREISSICRKEARKIATAGVASRQRTKITQARIKEFLGIPKYRGPEQKPRQSDIGVATGLAWTETGGELLNLEVSILEGKGELVLTGHLGTVMQESVRAALSFARSLIREYQLPKDFHRRFDLHIHFPEGAIPKDGPSAGVTVATALISALGGHPVRSDIAMTGEITLRGKVLPVGGIKEKLLAAHRAGITKVLIPEENQKDLEEVPAVVFEKMVVKPVSTMNEVLDEALE